MMMMIIETLLCGFNPDPSNTNVSLTGSIIGLDNTSGATDKAFIMSRCLAKSKGVNPSEFLQLLIVINGY